MKMSFKVPGIEIPIILLKNRSENLSSISNDEMEYMKSKNFFEKIYRYLPFLNSRFNSIHIQFIQNYLKMDDAKFSEWQSTSEKCVRKWKNCPLSQKMDLTWQAERCIRFDILMSTYGVWTDERDIEMFWSIRQAPEKQYLENLITFDIETKRISEEDPYKF